MNPTNPQTPAIPSTASETDLDKFEAPPGTRIYPKAMLRMNTRRAAIEQIIAEAGSVPTHFQLLNQLRERNIKSSKGSVLNDLIALGISNARKAYGRPAEPASGESSDF